MVVLVWLFAGLSMGVAGLVGGVLIWLFWPFLVWWGWASSRRKS